MKIIKTSLSGVRKKRMSLFFKITNGLLLPFFLCISLIFRMKGAMIHFKLIFILMFLFFKKKLTSKNLFKLMVCPFDSVRYYEAYVFCKILKNNILKNINYLDVSSPRIFPFIFCLKKNKYIKNSVLINPDNEDLTETLSLFQKNTMPCKLQNIKVGDLPEDEKFDFITCISVLEHIPEEGDIDAVNKIWRILRKGGFLYITVPCSNEEINEYKDIDPYGLNKEKSCEYYFFQRFYDKNMLENRLFKTTGNPLLMETFGERSPGRMHKLDIMKRNAHYVPSAESLITFFNIKKLSRFDNLNNSGVVCMLFKKQED